VSRDQVRQRASIFGLTVWQPWAWALAAGVKDVENRDWQPPPKAVGGFIAIHAGKTWDSEGYPGFVRMLAAASSAAEPPDPMRVAHGAIVGVARLLSVVRDSPSPWFCGPIGWQMGDAVAIEPVPCRGDRKLWELPPDVLWEVRARYAAARAVRAPHVMREYQR
jgi:hypothetical protein